MHQAGSRSASSGQTKGNPVALVVEDDNDQRELIGAILEESDVQVIACESGEAAMQVMEVVGDRTVFLLADVGLAGVMDGVDLACEVDDRWPHTRLVTTSGYCEPSRLRALPRGTKHLPKPWRALDLIIELEHAIASRQPA
ncbi:response regulator [Pseudorhodoplanes sinuspersici]|uniref:response regulator n=1 Tax=Pseudorhodoplanes sinuspersici TaxID=1235591 RepID=UPI000FF6B89E|nr:response regulator [Pseudorhodoplanes sinuspersici]RKE73571.1 response regulator receiver domain-containing protein [Pseudorhodoplanes sinuspersici]